MTSGKFILGETVRKDACVRFLLVLILLGVITVAVLVGCYAFNSVDEHYYEGCRQPELDPYGLSNWTRGADNVAFGCFPGHQMEGNDDVLISHCIGRTWHPPPPACAALPIALECPVDQNGIKGTITMWQMSNSTPTLIHGYVSTAGVDKERTVLLETFELSRNACIATTENITSAMPDAMPLGENQLEVRFNSTRLLAFKKAQIRLAMIFIDVPKNLTATVVTVHQGKAALVMRLPLPLPSASAGWSFDDAEENCGGNQREPIQAVEDGNGVRTKDEEFPASEDDAEEIATHMEDETVLPESRETKLEQESNYNTGNYPGQDYRTY